MRLLLVNPNTDPAVTERMAQVARCAASRGTEVTAVSAPSGIGLIATAADTERAGEAVAELLSERQASFDAAVIAAFIDPGLRQARAVVSKPVTALVEASMRAAGSRRLAVLVLADTLIPLVQSLAGAYGLGDRLAGVYVPPAVFAEVVAEPERFDDLFRQGCLHVVERYGAEAVIIGGGPFAGTAERIARQVPVPVLDPVVCAVREAERLAATPAPAGRAGGCR